MVSTIIKIITWIKSEIQRSNLTVISQTEWEGGVNARTSGFYIYVLFLITIVHNNYSLKKLKKLMNEQMNKTKYAQSFSQIH